MQECGLFCGELVLVVVCFFLWSLYFASVLEMYWLVTQDEEGQNVNWPSLPSSGHRQVAEVICNSVLKHTGDLQQLFGVQHLGR